MRISPDGRRAIFARWDLPIGNYVVWKVDFDRAVETRLSSERRGEMGGVWMRNGLGVFFSSAGRGGGLQLFYKDLRDGGEKQLLQTTAPVAGPQDVSPDGRLLAFFQRRADTTDIWTMPVDSTRPPSLLVSRAFDARFSPDGRFVAFVSSESSPGEVYVAPSSPSAERTRVSKGGASLLRWSGDGREIIYRSADGHIVSVAVRAGASQTIELGSPVRLFAIRGKWSRRDFDLSPDGRFLAIVPRLMANEQSLTVVLNWTAAVPR